MRYLRTFLFTLTVCVLILGIAGTSYAAEYEADAGAAASPQGLILCCQGSYVGEILEMDYEPASRAFTGIFGPYGPAFGMLQYGVLSMTFDANYGIEGYFPVTYLCRLTGVGPLVFQTYWVNSVGGVSGPHTLTQIACPPEDCRFPVAQSGIGSPGTTGWPYVLANICTANANGKIRSIGVDRWDREGLTWDIYLWDINCNLIAQASVTGGTGWYFADIVPWPVSAGQQFYIGYEVSAGEGSYLYRDTTSPVNLGHYTVEYANFGPIGSCPVDPNGDTVTPVDVRFCTAVGTLSELPVVERSGGAGTMVETDMLE